MNPEKRTAYVTRASILELLSDEEVARVSTAESSTRLVQGDEYLDLEKLDRGVHHASSGADVTPLGRVLPRKSVHPQTWSKILTHLEAARL